MIKDNEILAARVQIYSEVIRTASAAALTKDGIIPVAEKICEAVFKGLIEKKPEHSTNQ